MLTIPQLKHIEAGDPYLYEALKRIVGAVNSLGTRLGLDPAPATQSTPGQTVAAPPAPGAISVTGARGIFSVALAAPNAAVNPNLPSQSGAARTPSLPAPLSFFLEASPDPAFAQVTTYPLGGAMAANLSLGNVTRYWRARAKYIESDFGAYVYFGTAAQPTPVAGGVATSGDLAPNIASNFTNFATIDSVDAGSSATARIYGTGGPGSAWTRITGQGSTTFPPGTIAGLAYSTLYYIVWDGAAYLAFTSLPAALVDKFVAVGKVTTIDAGGSGGFTGGGGSSGGRGGGPPIVV
jgi:uncharacterized membrane protein YgcG